MFHSSEGISCGHPEEVKFACKNEQYNDWATDQIEHCGDKCKERCFKGPSKTSHCVSDLNGFHIKDRSWSNNVLPSIRKNIVEYVAACSMCSRKSLNVLKAGLLQPLPFPHSSHGKPIFFHIQRKPMLSQVFCLQMVTLQVSGSHSLHVLGISPSI